MDGTISIQDGGTVTQPIWIGGSLGSSGIIGYFDAEGLTNQVIINGNNLGGTWDGDVLMDYVPPSGSNPPTGTPLATAPYYSGASSTYGGGAVGLATFHLYDDDCVPVNGGSHAFSSITTVVLSFYGPIGWDDVHFSAPVIVSYSLDGTNWMPLPEEDFSCAIVGRYLTVTALTEFDFSDDFDYRIESVDGALYSLILTTPEVDFVYTIHAQ